MVTVRNFDINGKPIDLAAVVIHIDDFPEIVEESIKINAEYVRRKKKQHKNRRL